MLILFGTKLQHLRSFIALAGLIGRVAQSEATTRGGLGGDTVLQVVLGYQSLRGFCHVWLQSKYSTQERNKKKKPSSRRT